MINLCGACSEGRTEDCSGWCGIEFKPKIKKYTMDESLSWEERYKQLEKHHLEECKAYDEFIKDLLEMLVDQSRESVQRKL